MHLGPSTIDSHWSNSFGRLRSHSRFKALLESMFETLLVS
jgi:hypothetical protein